MPPPLPVSIKIRAGFDETAKNAVEIAKIAEAAGASFITVHGRTKTQMYSGQANLQIIEQVKTHVKIPVIGNGDIFSFQAALKMKKETGCDALMIARGAFGNPFIFEEIKSGFSGQTYIPPSDEQRIKTAILHLKKIIRFKGEKTAITESRKHMAWYFKGLCGGAKLRNLINQCDTLEQMLDLISYENLRDF